MLAININIMVSFVLAEQQLITGLNLLVSEWNAEGYVFIEIKLPISTIQQLSTNLSVMA